jgi:hypothetical protein
MKSLRELTMYTAAKHRASVPAGWYAVMNGAQRVGAVVIPLTNNARYAVPYYATVDTSVQPSPWKLVLDPYVSRQLNPPAPHTEIPLELNPDYSCQGWNEFFQQKFGGSWVNVYHYIERNANAIYNITDHRTWRLRDSKERWIPRKGAMFNLETQESTTDCLALTNTGIPLVWLVMNTYSEKSIDRDDHIAKIRARIGTSPGNIKFLAPFQDGFVMYVSRGRTIRTDGGDYRALDADALASIANQPALYVRRGAKFIKC